MKILKRILLGLVVSIGVWWLISPYVMEYFLAKRSWPAMEGLVLEEGTDKPIAGAIVVARWQGHGYHSSTICFHVESTVSDAQGTYVIPAWENTGEFATLQDQFVKIDAHKKSYRRSWKLAPNRAYLVRLSGTADEILQFLWSDSVKCTNAGESKKNLLPLYESLYEDVVDMAATREQKKTSHALLTKIESITLDPDEATRRRLDRAREIRK